MALEVTGSAFEVYDFLSSSQAEKVLLANPIEMKRLGSGRHTDRVDTTRLAKMLDLGTLPEVWVPPQEMRKVRRLLRYRERLGCTKRRLVSQGKAVLRRHGHLLPDEANIQDHLSQEAFAALPEADQAILGSVIRQITCLEEEMNGIEAQISRLVAAEIGVQLLLTITGVGLITAATTWSCIGDPQRF